MAEPASPDVETRERLLGVLGELVVHGGAARFLVAPVEPGPSAFPEPWSPTRGGVALLLRRLAIHAGLELAIEVEDLRAEGAPPTERKPATYVELVELVRAVGASTTTGARYTLGFVGADDVVGTVAHEIGVAHAALSRVEHADPYRSAETPEIAIDPDVDLVRGSIATVYLGLGVLAANAAFQQYSSAGRFNGGYVPLEYDVLRAGYVAMSELAFLLAVQAIVRRETTPPAGLEPPQRDEVAAWIRALRGRDAELRERLGIPGDATVVARAPASIFENVADATEADDAPVVRRNAFRWRTHRGGVGLIAGTVLGVSLAAIVASRGMAPGFALGGATVGHVVGRRVRVPRCSACATIVDPDATTCRKCGAALRGDIASLSERLEAEERLDA